MVSGGFRQIGDLVDEAHRSAEIFKFIGSNQFTG